MQTLQGPLPWAAFNMDLWWLPHPLCPRQRERKPGSFRVKIAQCTCWDGQAVRYIQRTVAQCHILEGSLLGLGSPQQVPTAMAELGTMCLLQQCPWDHGVHENWLNRASALHVTWVTDSGQL